MSRGTLGTNVDKTNAIHATIPPEMQTGRQPNLFTKPPTIGPALEIKSFTAIEYYL